MTSSKKNLKRRKGTKGGRSMRGGMHGTSLSKFGSDAAPFNKTGGGLNPSSYSDAASYGMAINGSGQAQFDRTFNGTGTAMYTSTSGQKVGGQRRKIGGRRRVGGQKRSKKGGFWGQIVNQAIVPFGLLGMQQSYRKKGTGGYHTKKRR